MKQVADIITGQIMTERQAQQRMPGKVITEIGASLSSANKSTLGVEDFVDNGGDGVPTGFAIMVEGVRTKEYRPLVAEENLAEAKRARDEDIFQPLTVNIGGIDRTFDMTPASQSNVIGTLQSFEAARSQFVSLAGWPDDGTIPWVLADDSVLPVTQTDLQLVHDGGVARGAYAHILYRAAKAAV